MYLYVDGIIKVNNHLKDIIENNKNNNVKEIETVKRLLEYLEADYTNTNERYDKFLASLGVKDIIDIINIFDGEKYEFLQLLFNDKNAKIYKDIWEKSANYVYSTGFYRRSYKSHKVPQLYTTKNIDKLKELIYLQTIDFTLDKYFKDNKEDYRYIDIISDIIAIELDNNNSEVLMQLKEVIYSENNTAIITREIIRGALMSENEEAHKMVGELFLAAKLQEGLRQTIVENLDSGSRKGFIYILKLIIANNLIRFSSVVRGLGAWTGLSLEVEKPKTIKKCFEAAYNCLIDEEYKKDCLESDDNLLIYLGLWAVAFDEIEDIKEILNTFLHGKIKYKKLIALEFIYESQFKELQHKLSCEVLEDNDLEVIALALRNLFSDMNCYSLEYNPQLLFKYKDLGQDYFGIKLFDKLRRLIDIFPKKEIKFDEIVFPWISLKISVNDLMEKIILSAGITDDNNIIGILIEHKDKMSSNTREFFVKTYFKASNNRKHKEALIELCKDRAQGVRENAFKVIQSMELTKEDYTKIENLLKFKYGDLRKNAIKLLLKQSSLNLAETVKKLAQAKDENKKSAALDIVNALLDKPEHKEIVDECSKYISNIQEGLSDTKDLSKKSQEEAKNFKNGFGLYDPSKDFVPAKIKKSNFNLQSKLSLKEAELLDILNKFSDLIHENRELEYEIIHWDDSKITVTLGGEYYLRPFNRENRGLDNYPLAKEIRELAVSLKLDAWKLVELNYYFSVMDNSRYSEYTEWFEEFLEINFNYKLVKKLEQLLKNIQYSEFIKTYINLLYNEVNKKELFEIGKTVSEYIFIVVPKEKHIEKYLKENDRYSYSWNRDKDYFSAAGAISYWLSMLRLNVPNEELFKVYFDIAYNFYKASEYNINGNIGITEFGNALELNFIDENEVLKEIIGRPQSSENIRILTTINNYNKEYIKLIELRDKAIEVIGRIEADRGELDTEITPLASNIYECFGVNIFGAIVLNSEKDTYVRGYNFIGGDCTKKQILSHLLKCCYPKASDNADSLKEFFKGKKVTDKQLIEAAMYSPSWLNIVSEYLGDDGLKSACWYFHAHVNDTFSDEKSAIVARYTPLSTEDLKDGAFDQKWFTEAYNTLGNKKFKVVYDSAKYIAGGALHKRSQLFADATLGKLKIKEVKTRVKDKRNKDYLLTYSLIPVKDEKDLLERYEFIQEFIKESKKFGAQRLASESRSGNIALINLAMNSGYSDVNRLTWNMETAKIQSILPYLELKAIEDVEVQLIIDELGQAEIVCIKNGKRLKNVPAKLKKHEYIVEINNLRKSLKDQYVRAKSSFEKAMEDGDIFKGEELVNLCENPVLAPIIKTLLFKAGDFIGYLSDNALVNYKDEKYDIKKKDNVIIAHPINLYEAKVWHAYQKDIFSKKVVQPFKQVFRELYMPNCDELKEKTLSRRYAGHQVQPKKTVALLKTRGWIASNEEGLQKVYYKDNIIATIYAQADWFSPADIEAPVLEFVRFEDRKTYKPLDLGEISKLIFSEVMRDLDLVVSVAHVGGVDPEASLSTIEIRTVIIEEILKLMKISNVKLKGSHAYITGAHGEYTVHLGSGVVHKMGSGSINIISVHSEHRGKIFLPFIDSDPRSAEIISKITLLAEDTKIKDPSILEQITG